MFKLVGEELFCFGRKKEYKGEQQQQSTLTRPGRIEILPAAALGFSYKLEINGKPFETFCQSLQYALKSWSVPVGPAQHLVTLG